MLAPSGAEPVAEPEEVFFVNRIEHLRHRSLHDLVFNRRNSQWSLVPVCFSNVRPACRLGPVCSSLHPAAQLSDLLLKSFAVFFPSHSVDTSRRSLPQLAVYVRQPFFRDVVEQSREFHLTVPLCCFPHPIKRIGRTLPALCPACVLPNQVPLGCTPSLHPVRPRFRGFVPELRRYYWR